MKGLLFVAALASLSLYGENLLIETAGTATLPSGVHTYGAISNHVSSASVTLAQDGTDWNRISTFDAVTDSKTTLDNVRFDFGTTSASTLNFFGGRSAGDANRLLRIDNGSVVTNIGCLIVTRSTGASAKDNAILVTGASTVSVAKVVVAYYDQTAWNGVYLADNRASFTLDGGSALFCKGSFLTGNALSMGDGVNDRNMGICGVFSGVGTYAKIGGTLSIGNDSAYGGHHGVVSNGAVVVAGSASLGGGSGNTEGYNNSLTVVDGGRLETSGFSMSTAYAAPKVAKPVGDRFEILADGVYTNTGDFAVGYSDSAKPCKWGMTILVSNGVFRTSGGQYRFAVHPNCSNNTVIVSGPSARFSVGGSTYYYFNAGPGNRYVFENGVDYDTTFGAAVYTTKASNEEIRVRSGATFRFAGANGFNFGPVGDAARLDDSRFVVEGGATASGTVFRVGGDGNTLCVSNALVTVTGSPNYLYALDIGDSGMSVRTNATLVLAGNAPRIVSQGRLRVTNGSELRFELPPEGYEEGVIPINLDGNMIVSSGSTVTLSGIDAMLSRHYDLGKKASYTLARATTLSIPAGVMDSLTNALPAGVTLTQATDPVIARTSLILSVRPKRGLTIIVK